MYWTSPVRFTHGFFADHSQEDSAESGPLEASCTVVDRHRVRPHSSEAGRRLDRTRQVFLSTAQLDFSSGSETPAGVFPQRGSSCLAACHSMSVAKAHPEEDPGAPRSKGGEGIWPVFLIIVAEHLTEATWRGPLAEVFIVLPNRGGLSTFMVARACQKPHYSRRWKLESAQARAGARPQDPPSPTNLLFPEKSPPSTGFTDCRNRVTCWRPKWKHA